MNYEKLKHHFQHPDAMDRSAPFWSWNDRMDPDEVQAQAHDMHLKGMGGYFMHSRVGLETEYLGKEWMNCVKACVEQACADGTHAWLYDEDRWPSGAAGGLVTRDCKEYAAKGIRFRESEKRRLASEEVLYTYAIVLEGDKLVSARLLPENGRRKNGEIYLHVCLEYAPSSEWYNNAPPADNINKDCVKRFLEITMEKYKEEVGEHFGKSVPGVFTDEPNVSLIPGCYPYTYAFPSFFMEKRGYLLTNVLPWVFYEGDQCMQARHDFFRTYYEMFAEHFSKQFYDWCEGNGLLFTGHCLAENVMGAYIRLCGGILLNYLYQHVPGIDMLREDTIEYMTIKGCTSVANQTGRNRMLSETYGVSGWEFSFEGQKWIGDYQYVQGINLRCQHLAWYSMKGMRKRDYPPQFNYQTSWWKYNNIVEDYFARIGAVTSKGRVVRDTLMIHPLPTAWIRTRLDNMEEIDRFGFNLNEYTKNMLSNHIDFDYGDEDVIQRIGRVEKDSMVVGQASYQQVVIPPGTETLYENTAGHLLEYMENGGKVICQESEIMYIEGRKNELAQRLQGHANFIRTNTLDETVSHLRRVVSIKSPTGNEAENVFCMVRDMEDARVLFLTNNDREQGVRTRIMIQGDGTLEEWDLLDGGNKEIPFDPGKGVIGFDCELGACDSRLFVLRKDGPAGKATQEKEKKYVFLQGLGISCPFERTDKNVMVLDMCRMKLEDGGWSREQEVYINQEIIRRKLKMIPVDHNGGVQRYMWVDKPHAHDGAKLAIRFSFNVKDVPAGPVQLVVEEIDTFSILCNGQEVENKKQGWFLDKCMGVVNLPPLRKGRNELVLECAYQQKTELENIFLIGDFGVSIQRNIVREPERIRLGDWGLQGYFHYHSGIKYLYDFEYSEKTSRDIMMDFGRYSAVVVLVRINGHEVCIPWKCRSRIQIGDYLHPGNNRIEVEVMASPRNMFGPLHLSDTREKWIGDRALHPDQARYTPDYTTYPWGLMEQICIYGPKDTGYDVL
ncbi:MAG: glycosyl hydrolase [Clostridia bacterium]